MTRSLLIAMLLVTVLRCSSIQEHGVETNNWGHPYIGTQISITSFPCLVELSSILFYIPVLLSFSMYPCRLSWIRFYCRGFSDQTGRKKTNNG